MRRAFPLPLLLALPGAAPVIASAQSEPPPATFWVTHLGAAGPGSFRAAVDAANAHPGADHVRFARGLAGTVPMNGPALTIEDALHVHGPGGTQIRLRGDSQNGILRILARAGEVVLEGLYLTDAGDGAIVNEGAILTVDACTLRANFGARGAAIASYGGDLYLRRSIVRDNYSEARGGEQDGLGGGVYARDAAVTIDASRLSANIAESLGGGLYADLPAEGALLVRDSVIDVNAAWSQAGGLAVMTHGGPPAGVINSTISGNRSTRYAAVWFQGGLVVNNSTIADNYGVMMEIPGLCAGLCAAGRDNELWLNSTLLAANRDAFGDGYDLVPTAQATHVSHSLVERMPDLPFDDRGGNRLNVDPRLGPLLDNGGALPTQALAAGSPAIDAGINPSLLQHDQRGGCHARVVGSAPDIGAYEYQPGSGIGGRPRFPFCAPMPRRR